MAGEAVPESKQKTIKLKITRTSHVQPRKKLGRREIQLVTFDLPYLAFYYNQKLMIYRGDNFEEMVAKMKDGLTVLLEEFYELAGKLGKDEDGVFKVVYDDDMEGAEVTEAIAEDVGVDELIERDVSLMKELTPYNLILNLEGLQRPLLAVQLTKLHGGIAIGCAFNHAVLDGSSTWHFMTSWAELCNGKSSISIQPFHDRTKARNTRVKLDLTPPASHAPPPPEKDNTEESHKTTNGTTTTETPTLVPVAPTDPPLREKVFQFSEVAIEKIKAKANSNGATQFSTFQSLSAHIWKAVTAARQLKPEDYTVFTVFVDCRKRVEPPMPQSYFGNLIQAIFTVTAAGLVLANPPEFSAGMVKGAIDAHTAEAIDKRNTEWEAKPIIFQYKDAGVNCVAVGSSPRFKVYDVDFGWGKPETVRSGCNNRFDGMVYLYPGKIGGKSIDVEISLEVKAMERLEKDKEFLMEEA